jgi:hypothetical protein
MYSSFICTTLLHSVNDDENVHIISLHRKAIMMAFCYICADQSAGTGYIIFFFSFYYNNHPVPIHKDPYARSVALFYVTRMIINSCINNLTTIRSKYWTRTTKAKCSICRSPQRRHTVYSLTSQDCCCHKINSKQNGEQISSFLI